MNDRLAKADLVALPPIPAKRYFTIGEVSDLCGVKPYVLRYWEQEFTQLKPMKRRGNRRWRPTCIVRCRSPKCARRRKKICRP